MVALLQYFSKPIFLSGPLRKNFSTSDWPEIHRAVLLKT